MTLRHFVGRDYHIERILHSEPESPEHRGFFDIAGDPGTGKSSLLKQLADDHVAGGEDGSIAILLSGAEHAAPRGIDRRGAQAVMAREFIQFRRLLSTALARLPEDAAVDLRLTLRSHSGRATAGFLNPSGGGSPDVGAAPPEIAYDPRRAAELIASAQDAVNTFAGSRWDAPPLLVLVDRFEQLAGRPIGEWLTELLSGLDGTLVVLAHRPLPAERLRLPGFAVALPLDRLSQEDVTIYLRKRDCLGSDEDAIAGPVYAFTQGHAGAVALAADLIAENRGPEHSADVVRQLAEEKAPPARKLGELVDRLLDAVSDDDVRAALDPLWVVRRFDYRLLRELLHGHDERHVHAVFEKLRRYSFVVEPSQPDGEDPYFTVSAFVRRHAGRDLRQAYPEEFRDYHRRAAAYYEELLREYGSDGPEYEAWFRYEDPHWQDMKREWLYHVSNLRGPDRATGRIGVARMFLDAFWWWGVYVPFLFCEEIIADWAEVAADNEDRAWLDALRTVNERYPRGWRQSEAPRQDWALVRRALLYLEHHGGLTELEPGDRERRHIAGIVDLFLADTYRFVDPSDLQADQRLTGALEAFEGEDDWDAAWVEYIRADIALARDQPEKAEELVAGLVSERSDLDDRELWGNLHRVAADIAWVRGDADDALDAHARSVLHAYHFQIKEKADEYTVQFQDEMTARTLARLADLHARGEGDLVLRACARIREFFAPYWQEAGPGAASELDVAAALGEGRAEEVAAYLYPAGPGLTDLHLVGTSFEGIALAVTKQMSAEIAAPPGTPLPRPA